MFKKRGRVARSARWAHNPEISGSNPLPAIFLIAPSNIIDMRKIAETLHVLHGDHLQIRLISGFREKKSARRSHPLVKGPEIVRKIVFVPYGEFGKKALAMVRSALRKGGTNLQDHLKPADRSREVFATLQDALDPRDKKRRGTLDNDDWHSEHPYVPFFAMQLQVLTRIDPKTPNKKKIYRLFNALQALGHKPEEFFFVGR